MKLPRISATVSVALAISLWIVNLASAEIPNKSMEQLYAAASHVFTGTVHQTYERNEKRGDYEYTHGVAEVAVERVDKGADVAASDRVFVRYWRQKWVGAGYAPPGHSGHRNIPAKGEAAEIYVKGDRKTGFDVLSPNGFFAVKKAAPAGNSAP